MAVNTASAETRHVFCVGNSLIDGLSWQTRRERGGWLAYLESSGVSTMVFTKAIVAGANLDYIWNLRPALYQPLTNGGWDTLVLEPYDHLLYDSKPDLHTPPSFDWGDVTNAVNFIKFALTENPDIQVYIYSHWPGVPNNQSHADYMSKINPATGLLYTWDEAEAARQVAITAFDFDTSWDAVYTNYNGYTDHRSRSYFEMLVKELEKQNLTNLTHEICIIPVGDVMYAVNQKLKAGALPGFDKIKLVHQDKTHLRPGIGRILMAATWYATLFDKSPEGLDYTVYNVESNSLAATNLYGLIDTPYYVEISPEFASLVQSTAWEVVRSHPFAGIAPLDYDRDGLPNSWEKQYFGSKINASPNVICSNGINTLIEAYIADLNPLGTNRFRLQMQISGGGCSWNAISGRVYDVYFTTNLLNNFTPLYTNVPWTANSLTNNGDSGFYRIDIHLP